MIKKQQIGILLFASTLLSISLALYNNFPITYPDTAAYLASGIDNNLPLDRPIFYGWFLRYTHFNDNLIFSVIAQGLLASYVMYIFFQAFSRSQNKLIHFLLAITFLCCFTGYSFFISFLMPDIFTPILLLSITCLFFADVSRLHFWLLFIISMYATIVHNSHFPLLLMCLILLGVVYVWRYKGIQKKVYLNKWLTIIAIFSSSIALSLIVNYSYSQQVFLSRNGHVFFTSRLHELGILESFLSEKCPETPYVLCPYKDSIPADFIWDMSSPLHKTGGFQSSGPEYKRMISDLVTNPKYAKKIVVASIASTLQQIGSFEIEPQRPNVLPYINEKFSVHRTTQAISFQNRGSGRLDFVLLNFIQNLVVVFSFATLVLLLSFRQNWYLPHRQIIVFLLWTLVINAFVCSTFSTILTRYQGRVIFLIPLVLILILPGMNWNSIFKRIYLGTEK